MHTYTHRHIYIHTHTHVAMHTFLYTDVYTQECLSVCLSVCLYGWMDGYMYINRYTCMYAYGYMYTTLHTCVYVHCTYIHGQRTVSLLLLLFPLASPLPAQPVAGQGPSSSTLLGLGGHCRGASDSSYRSSGSSRGFGV